METMTSSKSVSIMPMRQVNEKARVSNRGTRGTNSDKRNTA
jgi:hypothetical protein